MHNIEECWGFYFPSPFQKRGNHATETLYGFLRHTISKIWSCWFGAMRDALPPVPGEGQPEPQPGQRRLNKEAERREAIPGRSECHVREREGPRTIPKFLAWSPKGGWHPWGRRREKPQQGLSLLWSKAKRGQVSLIKIVLRHLVKGIGKAPREPDSLSGLWMRRS